MCRGSYLMKLPYEIFVSLRYLKTKKRYGTISLNTFISIAGVVIGVATSIITLAVMTGFQGYFRDKILSALPHVVVLEFTGSGMKDEKAVEEKIKNIPHVMATTPFVYAQSMITTKERMQGIQVRGIDPGKEVNVTDIAKNMTSGSLRDLDRPDAKLPGIIMGVDLARKLGVSVGDGVTMVNPLGEETPLGMVPKMKKFQVVGLFDAGMYDYNMTFVYISLTDAQKFFDMAGRVSGVQIRVDEIYNADRISSMIQATLGYPYYTRNWMEMNKNFFSALLLEKIGMSLILVVIIVVASFNIVGTLTMIVMEKNREIAILKSMGSSAQSIVKIFMFAGLAIGFVGTAIGVVIGYGAVVILTKSDIISLPKDVYQVSHLPLSTSGLDVLFISLTALLISFLATLYPSWQAARQDPVEVLRYE
jgi:lipoprotein-releasing system permease protein